MRTYPRVCLVDPNTCERGDGRVRIRTKCGVKKKKIFMRRDLVLLVVGVVLTIGVSFFLLMELPVVDT